jgi:HopA1 effector protein family
MGDRLVNAYRDQVAGALRAVAVTSPTSFAWFGSGSRPLPRAVVATLPAATSRRYLIDALQRELYRSFYSQGRPEPARPDRGVPARSDPEFVQALSLANCGSGGWETGWRVERVGRGIVQVERDGLSVRARAADCRAHGDPRKVGARVSLRRPKELGADAPGFYMALGDVAATERRVGVEVRVYFNVTAAGAAPLVEACTRRLNAERIHFSLKVLDHLTGFTRCDAAVLYLEPGDFGRARESLSAIASACAPYLRSEHPAFTKPLARGVSLGEHLRSLGGSFGSSRCRMLAEGVVTSHERGDERLADRVEAVTRRFAESGVDLDSPYLAPGSSGRYAL